MAKKKKDAAVKVVKPVTSRHFVEHRTKAEKKFQTFDEFWLYISKAKKLPEHMKPHLRVYFKSLGILNTPGAYEGALKKFGL